MPERSYTDAELAAAVAGARSWRGVLRALGLTATSSAAIRSVRARAEALQVGHDHFTGQRRWTEKELEAAVAVSRSWPEVATALGLAVGSSTTVLKGYATRLGLSVDHLSSRQVTLGEAAPRPSLARLPQAGSLLAASWLVLSGFDVSWPLEPSAFDLIAHRDGELLRVQVKTTRTRAAGAWTVKVRTSGRGQHPYDPDDIDHFFVIDGALDCYLIPVAAVAGRQVLSLRSYEGFRVEGLPSR